jgi:hypothetical protein
MGTVQKFVALALLAVALGVSGCGTPGAPMPPSLNLPVVVSDLAATRTGDQVSLTWTMPRKTTDNLLLKNNIAVHVCRKEGTGECDVVGNDLEIAPGTAGSFAETLPAALRTGRPRALTYFVELKNRNGRSAGPSNASVVVAGQAPVPVTGLTAELRKEGVLLHWKPDGAETGSEQMAIRLHRTLLTLETNARLKKQESLLTPVPEPVERNLLVEPGKGGHERALDAEVRTGQSYEYRAQRIVRITVDGKKLELAGAFSAPVRIEVKDIFPPAVPTALVAVAAVEDSTSFIDLSWQPVGDADLAGYIVYRAAGVEAWERISPPQPIVGPAYRDSEVLAGHTYRYRVSAIDQTGHESAPSAEAEETVPAP